MKLEFSPIELFEILSYLAVIIGIPFSIYIFYIEKKRERLDREYGTYNALDERYLQFLELCLENYDLDVFDVPIENKRRNTQEQERKELILFSILISIFERAFLMYRDQSTEIKKTQWEGWNHYMQDYCSRENFRRAWKILGEGEQFEINFVNYMRSIIREIEIAS